MTSASSISVVVSTRGRASHAAQCARSILACDGCSEVIFVDQSDDEETDKVLSEVLDPRLRYIRTETRGVTNGRNVGIAASHGEIIAFTDDDCRVASDWLTRINAIFSSDSEVAVVCGRVSVPDALRATGYAEAFEPTIRIWRGQYPPLGRDWGITANLAIRRSVIRQIGAFDPVLGPGGRLGAGGGEESDLLFRVLRAGFTVVNAGEVSVEHYGIRKPGAEMRNLIVGYGIGTAAAIFKHVRLGDPAAIRLYARFLTAAVSMVASRILRGVRPTGANYLRAFITGTALSFRFPIDRRTRQYRPNR